MPSLRASYCLWAGLFLFANIIFPQIDNTNGHSRFAALSALVEEGTFRIDPYVPMTVDWAKTPDGHYYSNKAPGPVLVALPIFWIMDKAITIGKETRADRDEARLRYRRTTLHVLSFLLQAVPFVFIVLLWLEWLAFHGVERRGLQLTAGALFFGTTATLFMNTYFGHGITAVLVLATLYSLVRRRFVLAGLLMGCSVLCDYAMALLVVPFLVYLFFSEQRKAPVMNAILGGIVPMAIWGWYHSVCFGSPWALPNRYQNPDFVEAARYSVWGVVNWIPEPEIIANLLAGASRGILVTQPWIFVLGVVLWRMRSRVFPARHLLLGSAVLGLALLLWFNASFSGWHGGNSPGPRYLSAIFPCWALWIGLVWGLAYRGERNLILFGLFVSFALWASVAATNFSAPPGQSLWNFYLLQWQSAKPIRAVGAFAWLVLMIVTFLVPSDKLRPAITAKNS